MAFGTKVAFEPLRSVAFGSIGGTYAVLGTPLTDNARLINFSNALNQPVFLSLNGVDDHIFLAPDSFELLDLTTNRVRDDGLFLGVGTQLYVKAVGSLPTNGTIYVSVMYAQGGK